MLPSSDGTPWGLASPARFGWTGGQTPPSEENRMRPKPTTLSAAVVALVVLSGCGTTSEPSAAASTAPAVTAAPSVRSE